MVATPAPLRARGGRTLPSVLAALGYHHRLDGAAKSFLNLLVRLPDAGYRPIAVFLGEGACTDAYRSAGVDVRVLEADSGFDRFNKEWLAGWSLWRARSLAVGLPRLTHQVSQLIREERVAIAHFNESRALLALCWAPRLAGVPTILHVRGSLRPLPAPLRVAVQAVPDRLILVGESLTSDLNAKFRRKAAVIHNSVSVPPAPRYLPDRSERPLRVLTLAAYEPFKGYHHLARAARRVAAQLSPRRVEFRWFGNTVDPDYRSHIDELANEAGSGVVRTGDWIPDVEAELRAADLVVLPTVSDEVLSFGGRQTRVRSSEGVPRCLLEASAFARATVATRVGGIPEAVDDGVTGILVPPSDPIALADTIVALLRDPVRRQALGLAGRDRVSAHFSHEALVRNTTDQYRQLTASHGWAAG